MGDYACAMASLSSESRSATEHALPESPTSRGSEQEVVDRSAGDADEEVKEWNVAENTAEEDGAMPGGVMRSTFAGAGVQDASRLFEAMPRSGEVCEKSRLSHCQMVRPKAEARVMENAMAQGRSVAISSIENAAGQSISYGMRGGKV